MDGSRLGETVEVYLFKQFDPERSWLDQIPDVRARFGTLELWRPVHFTCVNYSDRSGTLFGEFKELMQTGQLPNRPGHGWGAALIGHLDGHDFELYLPGRPPENDELRRSYQNVVFWGYSLEYLSS